MNQQGSVAVSNSNPPYLQHFSTGSVVGPGWNSWGSISSASNLFGSSVLGGFRVYQGSGYHTYGWFNATINGSSSFTLNSYGYNSTPNVAAFAGQGNVAGAPVAGVPDTGPGIVGLALLGAGAAGVRLLRKLRAGK